MELKNSQVKRGGVTSAYWYGGTKSISASSVTAGGLRFRFTLPSKGGGDTQIELTVGAEDVRSLLQDLANHYPELAGLFAECTQVAVSALLSSTAEQS